MRHPICILLVCWIGAVVAIGDDKWGPSHASLTDHPEMLESPLFADEIPSYFAEPTELRDSIIDDHVEVISQDDALSRFLRAGSGLRFSFDAMIGRRLERLSDYESSPNNGGFRLTLQGDFASDYFGFSSWEAGTEWLGGDSFGFLQHTTQSTIYNPAISDEGILLTTIDRWETRGTQPFASGQWNLRRELAAKPLGDRWNVGQLLGVRYIYSGEEYDTVFFGSTTISDSSYSASSESERRPVSASNLTNQMLGLQMGCDATWTAERLQFTTRVMGRPAGQLCRQRWLGHGTRSDSVVELAGASPLFR